jgi:hypothetical protein
MGKKSHLCGREKEKTTKTQRHKEHKERLIKIFVFFVSLWFSSRLQFKPGFFLQSTPTITVKPTFLLRQYTEVPHKI